MRYTQLWALTDEPCHLKTSFHMITASTLHGQPYRPLVHASCSEDFVGCMTAILESIPVINSETVLALPTGALLPKRLQISRMFNLIPCTGTPLCSLLSSRDMLHPQMVSHSGPLYRHKRMSEIRSA